MATPAQIRKRVRELKQKISEIQAANQHDRLCRNRDIHTRHGERDRKQRLQRILEELSSLIDLSQEENK